MMFPALSLAMARDGSSGGVIRMVVLTESGVERIFVPGNQLPTFWQGKEVLPNLPSKKVGRSEGGGVPIEVET
jgi:20S proteasome subunit beta 1